MFTAGTQVSSSADYHRLVRTRNARPLLAASVLAPSWQRRRVVGFDFCASTLILVQVQALRVLGVELLTKY